MSLKGGGVGRFSRQMGGLNKDSCCSSTSNTSTLTWGVRIFIICGILTCISLLWNSEVPFPCIIL